MTHIIDRRLNGKNKSTVNRQRFLDRYKKHIKEAVNQTIKQRSIKDMEKGTEISLPSRDVSEPIFHHGPGGVNTRVHPGNKEFHQGDVIARPPSGGGGGGLGEGQASNQGEGMDDFVFQISQEEFLDYMFEDLELPNLVRKQLKDASNFEYRRAGYTSVGTPDKLNVVRSLRNAHARRIALGGKKRKRVKEILEELEALDQQCLDNEVSDIEANVIRAALFQELEELRHKLGKLPFIDDFDLRYNNLIKVPLPSTRAVMFCVMDVSGSMTQAIKDIAKRFFILLYLFLKRNYKQIDVVFIRHHTTAQEVDEETFFYSRETGGTIVSSALELTSEVIQKRYNPADWNIYVAQASDGDNWDDDSIRCAKLLLKDIMPKVQYFAYVEIGSRFHQNLWEEYRQVAATYPDQFAMQDLTDASDIYPVFRELFERRDA
ncbi:YeaH/YhbH family protein [Litoribrevibacter albus]|uniref:UPF0229 protein GCM10007876_03110 n=1 Tax=Litoribrevibacter albus TaxID=1473156 RepID=A0AA37W5U2_9GAMM|nr:YeaH/YhbH family protein [Litoribrevibacter albus]GLQ29833.1 UPF0229 protein [Litoribrevibacter albus]